MIAASYHPKRRAKWQKQESPVSMMTGSKIKWSKLFQIKTEEKYNINMNTLRTTATNSTFPEDDRIITNSD